MLKTVVITETDEQEFEKEVEAIINGKAVWHKDFKKLISVNYSYSRSAGFYESQVYSALIIYES